MRTTLNRQSAAKIFYLPLSETRKTVEEIPSHKRAVRFALLDEIDAAVFRAIESFKVGG